MFNGVAVFWIIYIGAGLLWLLYILGWVSYVLLAIYMSREIERERAKYIIFGKSL